MSLDYLLTALIVVLIPGTGVIYTISIALAQGASRGIIAALGCTAGIVPHLAASILGIAALLHTSAVAFSIVKYAGVAYLLYLAWGMWRDNQGLSLSVEKQQEKVHTIILRGIFLNTLNPKLSIFFLAFLPQFINPAAGADLFQLLMLSTVFMALTFIVFAGYALCAQVFRTFLLQNKKTMGVLQKSFAAFFVFFGIKLALSER